MSLLIIISISFLIGLVVLIGGLFWMQRFCLFGVSINKNIILLLLLLVVIVMVIVILVIVVILSSSNIKYYFKNNYTTFVC